MKKFWALIIEPNKLSTHILRNSVHVACLDISESPAGTSEVNDKPVKVMLIKGRNVLLCTLHGESIPQVALDLNFQKRMKVVCSADACVHLTGYTVPEEDDDNDNNKLEGGVEIVDSEIGTGESAESGDFVTISYKGRLTNGTKFEKEMLGFCLGEADGVIRGLHIGIVKMKIGGRRRVQIPPTAVYQLAQVWLDYEGSSYLICTLRDTLQNQLVLQVPLDLDLESGKEVTFRTEGYVYLTGHQIVTNTS